MARGRRSKYTPETVKKIIDAVRVGGTHRIACQYAGIDEDTLIRWRDRYTDFAEKLHEAEGAGPVGWLAKIEQAASSGDWRAAAWKLERRFPQEYGKQVTEIQGKDGEPIAVDIDPRNSLAGRIAGLAARVGAPALDQPTQQD